MSGNIKNEFLELLRCTERDGVEDMIEELESNGFFEAPASAGHHLNVAGGLTEHSLNTCKSALAIWEGMKTLQPALEKTTPKESVIIAALLHDVCKSDVYFRTVKKKKTAIGTWEDSEGYKVSYKNFPMGHGEKSVIMVLPFLELTDAEMLAIRWHMGVWGVDKSNYEEVRNYDTACKLYPLVSIVHAADMLSSHILESGGDDEDL